MSASKVVKVSETNFSTAVVQYRQETVRKAAQQVNSRNTGQTRVVSTERKTMGKKITETNTVTKSTTVKVTHSADCITTTAQTQSTKTRTVKIQRVDFNKHKSEMAKKAYATLRMLRT